MLTCGRDMIAVDIGSGSFNGRKHMEKFVVEVMLTSPQLWHVGKLQKHREGQNLITLHQIGPIKSRRFHAVGFR